jgi:hypothetical protein
MVQYSLTFRLAYVTFYVTKATPEEIAMGAAQTNVTAKSTANGHDPGCRQGPRQIGTLSADWTERLTGETAQTLGAIEGANPAAAAAAALAGLTPQDEFEGMMAAQLIAAHAASMACYRCAMQEPDERGSRMKNLNLANRLTRTFLSLLTALQRRRGQRTDDRRRTGAEAEPTRHSSSVVRPPSSDSAKQPHAKDSRGNRPADGLAPQPALFVPPTRPGGRLTAVHNALMESTRINF